MIVGGGLAGAKAAETLREEGFAGRVVLIGAEPELPYERPPLSKGYLLGSAEREEARVHPRAFYAEHEIELLTGVAATALDTVEHRPALADGQELTVRPAAAGDGSGAAPPAAHRDRPGRRAHAAHAAGQRRAAAGVRPPAARSW